jgi:hypothetical protein
MTDGMKNNPHMAQYPTHTSFTSMWVAIEKENEFEANYKANLLW